VERSTSGKFCGWLLITTAMLSPSSQGVEVSLGYNPHGGKAGELVAELVNDPDKQVRRAVDDFRQVVERGGLVGG
jgi:uncharacterized membrane protein